jgi:hypothetical protein
MPGGIHMGHGRRHPSLVRVVELLQCRGADDKGYALDEETWFYREQGSAVLRRAGFADMSVETAEFAGRFADPEQALHWTLAWPCGSARFARLHAPERDAFIAEAREVLAGADLSWNFAFNIYIATKAAG